MFCIKCGEMISLLGLLDRKTGYKQFHCSNCNTIWLKNINGLIFNKEDLKTIGEQDDNISR